ncbi:MAG TPA: sulfatase-like hydrolase/transferase [Methylotenera sp.]|nr:sulfatase-like hydrolase/transferase [Methylotenera sp.]HPH05088.1 sulfatase-like hydrolase/transferase [Methylotenera sp.]HPN00452.1 sulfatase-like hydrolase/transferase [Methylotenera sp.]
MLNIKYKKPLTVFFTLTYLSILWIVSDSISFSSALEQGWLTFGFLVCAFLLYGLFYLTPSIAITALFVRFGNPYNARPTYISAVLSTGITSLLLYANAKIFSLYGMFFNGFILNLVMTPGGIESLGGSTASDIGYAIIAVGFLLLQAFLLWIAHRVGQLKIASKLSFKRLPVISVIATVLIHMGFALDNYTTNQLNMVAETVPFYQTVSARSFFKALGFNTHRDTKLKVAGKLIYPLNALQITPPAKPYNIIWLTSESLRADMLDDKIMPNSWDFSKNAARFTRNYSTGNGTRMGVFGMFMGLPGNYWFSFLETRRGAVLIDVLQKQNYQMSMYTSAKFSYPEFDKTIFAQVPAELLHETDTPQSGWESDRDNVTKLLEFIDKRDQSKPFFTFMFFESPHARYYFPPESVIAKPYRDDLNYATLSKEQLRADIVPIKNRYLNSVHHLDMQFGRIFEYMKTHQLLDNTIVILIGDHGEEFMEHGFWGHNSTFVDQQVMTPLVIYTPQMKPLVSNQMTSHMDIIPTIMPLLGVTNPSSDYAIGYNLLAGEKRSYTYISDWDKVTYVDDEVKIMQPVNGKSFALVKASKGDDSTLNPEERKAILAIKQPAMLQLVQDLSKFFKKKETKPANP